MNLRDGGHDLRVCQVIQEGLAGRPPLRAIAVGRALGIGEGHQGIEVLRQGVERVVDATAVGDTEAFLFPRAVEALHHPVRLRRPHARGAMLDLLDGRVQFVRIMERPTAELAPVVHTEGGWPAV